MLPMVLSIRSLSGKQKPPSMFSGGTFNSRTRVPKLKAYEAWIRWSPPGFQEVRKTWDSLKGDWCLQDQGRFHRRMLGSRWRKCTPATCWNHTTAFLSSSSHLAVVVLLLESDHGSASHWLWTCWQRIGEMRVRSFQLLSGRRKCDGEGVDWQCYDYDCVLMLAFSLWNVIVLSLFFVLCV